MFNENRWFDKQQRGCVEPKAPCFPEKLAVKHGMSHIALPIDDNVTYHQWHIGGVNALIRVKYHGFIPQDAQQVR